jgi:hypothetical protein
MRRWLALGTALAALTPAFAQPPDDANARRDALEWAVALRGRIRTMSNPVVATFGLARLGGVVCAQDPTSGAGIFREAFTALDNIPANAFEQRGTTPLPAASFSGLWKFTTSSAGQCDKSLAGIATTDRARARMAEERQRANLTLRRAYELLDPNLALDRASQMNRADQLVAAAMEAGDPAMLDIALLTQTLSLLRDRAPDLSDQLFTGALDFVMSPAVPIPDNLQELGKYLFTAPQYVRRPDIEQAHDSFEIGGIIVENLMATRDSANPDNIEQYLQAVTDLLANNDSVSFNPVVTYALVYQMLPRARDLAPDRVDALEKALAQLQSLGAAAQVQANLGPWLVPDPDANAAARDYYYTGKIRKLASAGGFDDARDLLAQLSDASLRTQVKALVDFAEAAHDIGQKRLDEALSLANLLRPGVKRTMLYAGLISAGGRDLALQVLPMAQRDAALLPAEQRVRLNSALATGMLKADVDTAFTVLDSLIRAYNDVYISPRRGRFDPRSARRTYEARADTSTDTALILPASGGFYEAVQTGFGRQNFRLRVPGVDAFGLGDFLIQAGGRADPAHLGAMLLSLRDENTQANALIDLAAGRMRAAR